MKYKLKSLVIIKIFCQSPSPSLYRGCRVLNFIYLFSRKWGRGCCPPSPSPWSLTWWRNQIPWKRETQAKSRQQNQKLKENTNPRPRNKKLTVQRRYRRTRLPSRRIDMIRHSMLHVTPAETKKHRSFSVADHFPVNFGVFLNVSIVLRWLDVVVP